MDVFFGKSLCQERLDRDGTNLLQEQKLGFFVIFGRDGVRGVLNEARILAVSSSFDRGGSVGFDCAVELLAPHQRAAPPIPILTFSLAGPGPLWELLQPRHCGDERLSLNQPLYFQIRIHPPVGPKDNQCFFFNDTPATEKDPPSAKST